MTGQITRANWVNARLDRFVRLNPDLCNPAWGGTALVTRFRPLLAEGLLRLVTFIGKEMRAGRMRIAARPVLVAVGSRNNYTSASAALGHRGDTTLAAFHNLTLPGAGRIGFLRQYLTGLWAVALLPLFLWREPRPYVRRAILARLDCFVLTMGTGTAIRRALEASGARLVVVMSLLSCYHGLIVEQAKRARIATAFLTHAPLGRGQMAMTTDYALLDGAFQLGLFPPSETRTRIAGSGRGRAQAEHFRDRSGLSGVVVATNTLMRDLSEIERLIRSLRQRQPDLPVAIRPHPADYARFAAHRELAHRLGARYHDPRQPLYEGLDDCKYLVSTQSGVILDALLLGFSPLIVRTPQIDRLLGSLPADYYGFAELDVCREIDASAPVLPLQWDARANLTQLDRSADPEWDTRGAVDSAIDAILSGEWDTERRD